MKKQTRRDKIWTSGKIWK